MMGNVQVVNTGDEMMLKEISGRMGEVINEVSKFLSLLDHHGYMLRDCVHKDYPHQDASRYQIYFTPVYVSVQCHKCNAILKEDLGPGIRRGKIFCHGCSTFAYLDGFRK